MVREEYYKCLTYVKHGCFGGDEMKFAEIFVLLAIVFVFFGAGKLPNVMGELGKGLNSFRKAMKEPEKEEENK